MENYKTASFKRWAPFKLHRLNDGPSTSVNVTKNQAEKYYTQMQTIRRIETAAGNLYKERIIRGFCHLYYGYGMGTSSDRASCNADYYTRGDALPGIWVDGMDVLAVRSATESAIDYVNKEGPLVMEVFTYRYSGHSMSDNGTSYRTREEIQEVRQKRDPITLFKELCIDLGLLSLDEIKEIDSKVRKEVDEATVAAKADKEIPLEEHWADVYSKNLEPMIRNTTGFNIKHKVVGCGEINV